MANPTIGLAIGQPQRVLDPNKKNSEYIYSWALLILSTLSG